MKSIFDLLLFPLGHRSAWPGLLLASALSTLLILLVYRLLSRPEATRRIKDRIKAHILALRLYKDFPLVLFRSFFQSLLLTLRYVLQNLLPLLALTPLLLVLFVQMDLRFGRRPFAVGEAIVVRARFSAPLSGLSAEIAADARVVPAMNPVWIDELREINWKLLARSPGTGPLILEASGGQSPKELAIATPYRALPELASNSFWDRLLAGAEAIAPGPPVSSVSIDYPGRRIRLWKFSASWIVHYLVIVFAAVLSLKKRFKVEF